MDKELKQVFDNLNKKETDKLIGDISDFEVGLNADRIMSQVYEKTGVKQRRIIPWRKIGMVASIAACFVLVFIGGYIAGGMGKNNTNPDNNFTGAGVNFADEGNDGKDAVADEKLGDISVDISDEKEETSDGKDGNKKDENREDDKENGNSSSDGKTHRPSSDKSDNDSDRIVIGTEDQYIEMNTETVEELLSNAADEIDLEVLTYEYETLDEMIEDVDYIVRGTKKGSLFSKGEESNTYILASKFSISSVIWDNTGNDISSSIKVNEGIIYNSENSIYTHMGGYERMKMDNEYILFLKKAGKDYYIAGTVYGKVPVSSEEPVLYIGDMETDITEKIKNIVQEARERYIDSEDDILSGEDEGNETADKTGAGDKAGTNAKTVTSDKTGTNDKTGTGDKTTKNEKNTKTAETRNISTGNSDETTMPTTTPDTSPISTVE